MRNSPTAKKGSIPLEGSLNSAIASLASIQLVVFLNGACSSAFQQYFIFTAESLVRPEPTPLRSSLDETKNQRRQQQRSGRRNAETFAPVRGRSALRRLHVGRSCRVAI